MCLNDLCLKSFSLWFLWNRLVGQYTAFYRLSTPDGVRFGPRVWCAFEVVDENDEIDESESDEQVDDELLVSFERGQLPSQPDDAQVEEQVEEQQQVEEQVEEQQPVEEKIEEQVEEKIEEQEKIEEEQVEEQEQDDFLYKSQFKQLSSMGFAGVGEEDRIKALLLQHQGNVLATVQTLLDDN